MDNTDIRIDKDGIWYYLGAHMFRKDILSIFFKCVKIDEEGKYIIDMGKEQCYLDVEDTVFVVESVVKIDDDGREHFNLLLTDDTWEELDLKTLYIGKDNILYCRVKEGKFPARFSRKSYYQLAEFIEEEKDGECFVINLNDKKYIIN